MDSGEIVGITQFHIHMAGYFGTPLIKELGITDAMKILLLNTQDNYHDLLLVDVTLQLVTLK